ncbi:hypothetical protein GLOTRDRAFT_133260, partial [Gloeophyllum trabeum ATCC 11539]
MSASWPAQDGAGSDEDRRRRSDSTSPLSGSSDESTPSGSQSATTTTTTSASAAYPPPPPSPSVEQPLLPAADRPPQRSLSSGAFVSSPLNPNHPASPPPPPQPRSRPVSRAGSMLFTRIASEDSQVLTGQRGSMLLYRLASDDDNGELLPPPRALAGGSNRDSVISSSGDSVFSISSDSKYPSGSLTHPRGLIP